MAKCPHCKKEITYLNDITQGTMRFDTSGYDALEPLDIALDSFECPECGRELFTNEIDAADFLEGNKTTMRVLITREIEVTATTREEAIELAKEILDEKVMEEQTTTPSLEGLFEFEVKE